MNIIIIIIIISVDKWRLHRRLISAAFNTNLIRQFFILFIEKSENLIRNLKKEISNTQPFDLWDYIAPTTLDMICRKSKRIV